MSYAYDMAGHTGQINKTAVSISRDVLNERNIDGWSQKRENATYLVHRHVQDAIETSPSLLVDRYTKPPITPPHTHIHSHHRDCTWHNSPPTARSEMFMKFCAGTNRLATLGPVRLLTRVFAPGID